MYKAGFVRYCVFAVVFIGLVASWQRAFTSANGSGGGYSGAPGENSCGTCHTGSVTTGSSIINFTVNGGKTYRYQPDSTYTITVSVTKSGISKWGFETTVLKDSTNTFVGTLAVSTSDVQTTSFKSRTYVEHTFSGTGGKGKISYTFTWTAPHKDAGTVTFYVAVNAANNDGFSSGDQILLNSFTLSAVPAGVPVAGFTFSPKATCEGDTINFKDTSTLKPTAWNWTFAGGSPSSSTLQNPKVVFTWGGHKVTLESTNGKGLSLPVTKSLFVVQKPTDTIFRSGPLEFCQGDSLILTGNNIANFWKWSTGDTTQSIVVKKSGSYFVNTSNGNCSKLSKTVKVKVHPLPTLSITRSPNTDTVCVGDTITYTLVTNGKTHAFYNRGNLIPKSTGLVLKVATLFGTTNKIYALAYDSLGCASDTSKNFKAIIHARSAAPSISAGVSTTQSVTVKWGSVPGAKAYEVSTDSGKTWKTPSGTLTHTQTGLKSNTYLNILVRVKDQPCPGLAAHLILSSLPCSQTTYGLRVDSNICPRAVARVMFSKISALHYAIILNGNSKKDTEYTFFPTNDTVLHFAMLDSLKASCGAFNIDIPVKIVPVALKMHISEDKPFYCGGNAMAVITGSGNYDEFDLYYNGLLVKKDSAHIYTNSFIKDGDRVVMRGKLGGCLSDSSNAIILHKYNAPIVGFTYALDANRLVHFTNTSFSDIKRTWHFGDGLTDTASKPDHIFNTNSNYVVSLVAVSKGGCSDSVTKTIAVSGIDNSAIDQQSLKIMPNPFKDAITVKFYGSKDGNLNLGIYNIIGDRVIDAIKIKMVEGENEKNIPLGDLPPGIYFLRIADGGLPLTIRIVKLP
jgi:PKD repeat protein